MRPSEREMHVTGFDLAVTPESELVQLEIAQLMREAQRCRDGERRIAIRAEIDVRVDSLIEMRRQQLLEQIQERAERPALRRRWWQRNGTPTSTRGG